MTHPRNKPTPRGKRNGMKIVDIASIYELYTPKSIKIKVLLTPGIITPADIKNPQITKNKKLYELKEMLGIVLSNITHKKPIQTETIVKKK